MAGTRASRGGVSGDPETLRTRAQLLDVVLRTTCAAPQGAAGSGGGGGGVKATSAACLSRRCAGLAGAEAKEKGGRAGRSAREGPHTRRRAGGNRGSRCFSSFLFVPLLIHCVCVCGGGGGVWPGRSAAAGGHPEGAGQGDLVRTQKVTRSPRIYFYKTHLETWLQQRWTRMTKEETDLGTFVSATRSPHPPRPRPQGPSVPEAARPPPAEDGGEADTAAQGKNGPSRTRCGRLLFYCFTSIR